MVIYCPILVDDTTDEGCWLGLRNVYRPVVHRLPLSPVRDYQITFQSGRQLLTSAHENYHYWSSRLANVAQDS